MKNQNSNSQPEKQVTISYDLFSPCGDFDLDFLIEVIRGNQYKGRIIQIREWKRQGKTEQANALKKSLPAATFACRYVQRRCEKNVVGYTSVVVLDADHLPPSEMVRIEAMLPSCRYTYSFFISPSGDGIKILVRTNGKKENHRQTYMAVMDYYSSLLGIQFDSHCSDVVRLTFLSWDPGAYLNREAEIFDARYLFPPYCPKPKQHLLPIPPYKECVNVVFNKAVRFTNRKSQFYEGNRNSYVFLLSCYCRISGLNQEDALREILNRFNFSQREITAAVKSAYRYK